METSSQNSVGVLQVPLNLINSVGVPQVSPNLINTVLPPDPLKMIFRALPASYRFVAPVCRRFRNLFGETIKEKKKHNTYKYSIASEAALQLYLETKVGGYARECEISMIGAGCGRMDWMERGGVFDDRTCSAAAKGGQLRILKWLRGRNCPWNSWTCKGAARNGHLEVLKWARENGCDWDSETCSAAAMNGHLETLKWARENGCEWDSQTCSGAAQYGHLEILQWAIENGYDNECVCFWAVEGGHTKILKWAIENGCPYDKRFFCRISDTEFFEWLGEYEANVDTERFVRRTSDIEFFEWLVEYGAN